MTKIEEITLRGKNSRIAAQLRKTADLYAKGSRKIGGCITHITVSQRAPGKGSKGWVEMKPGAEATADNGNTFKVTQKWIHDNIPSFTYTNSNEHPNKGVMIHIKTATLGGRARTWMKPN